MDENADISRRSFLARAFAVVNGLIALIVAIPALRYVLDPLAHSRKVDDYIRVIPLSALEANQPTRVQIVGQKTDAYTRYPPGTVGQVFVTRDTVAGSDPSIRCLQTICPHLGCSINYVSERENFACPCHSSDFDKNGKCRGGPAPRDMDPLECRVSPPDETGQRWVEVRYREFHVGVADRIAKS